MKKLFTLAALCCFTVAFVGCADTKKVEKSKTTETTETKPDGTKVETTETTETEKKVTEGDATDTTPAIDPATTPADPAPVDPAPEPETK